MFLFACVVGIGVAVGYAIYNREVVQEKYNKFVKLNQIVSEQNKDSSSLVNFCTSVKLAVKTWWLHNTTTATKVGKKYQIPYRINGKEYKLLVSAPWGPSPVLWVKDEKENIVTDKIVPYLGPQNNCHGSTITPRDLGYNKLYFQLPFDGRTFKDNEPILLT